MERYIHLNVTDIVQIVADTFEVSANDVTFSVTNPEFSIDVKEAIEELPSNKPQAYWEYWGGWAGNHDKRIDDATCSNCGFKHPTVRGGNAPDQLEKRCPRCGKRMGYKEV